MSFFQCVQASFGQGLRAAKRAVVAALPRALLSEESPGKAVFYRPSFSLTGGLSWNYQLEDRSVLECKELVAKWRLIRRIPEVQVLKYFIELPAAAVGDLHSVVELGLPKWTPFESRDVYFRANQMQWISDKIEVEIRLVPKIFVIESNDQIYDTILVGDNPKWEINIDTQKNKALQKIYYYKIILFFSALILLATCCVIGKMRLNSYLDKLHSIEREQIQIRKAERASIDKLTLLRKDISFAREPKGKRMRAEGVFTALAQALPERAILLEFHATPTQTSGRYLIENIRQKPEGSPLLRVRSARPLSSTNLIVEFDILQ